MYLSLTSNDDYYDLTLLLLKKFSLKTLLSVTILAKKAKKENKIKNKYILRIKNEISLRWPNIVCSFLWSHVWLVYWFQCLRSIRVLQTKAIYSYVLTLVFIYPNTLCILSPQHILMLCPNTCWLFAFHYNTTNKVLHFSWKIYDPTPTQHQKYGRNSFLLTKLKLQNDWRLRIAESLQMTTHLTIWVKYWKTSSACTPYVCSPYESSYSGE